MKELFNEKGELQRKIRVLDVTHHVMHQAHMIHALRDDCEFYYLANSWRSWWDKRFSDTRPIPKEINWVAEYEPGKYDVAILHIDQQAVNPNIHKGKIFRELDETIKDIPKIVLNHGCPVYPECTMLKQPGDTDEIAQDKCIEIMKKILHGLPMVVNSHTASSEKEWGWGTPIVHGMPHFTLEEEKEVKQHCKDTQKTKPFHTLEESFIEYENKLDKQGWWDLPKEPRFISALSPRGLDTYYNREKMLSTIGILKDTYGYPFYWCKTPFYNTRTMFKPSNFNEYRSYLGRSLIYLDVSQRTPMNRARSEAFFSGVCVVQVEGAHDLERWAKPGENMIIVPNKPSEIAKTLVDLVENRADECLEIGRKGKEMAMKEFNPERYRESWLKLLTKVCSK